MRKFFNIETLLKYPIIFYAIYFLYLLRPSLGDISPKLTRIDHLFHYALMLYALILIIYNIKNRKYLIKDNNVKVVLLLSIFMSITIILNIRTMGMEALKSSVLVIYSLIITVPAYRILRERYIKSQIFKFIFYPGFIFKFFISIFTLFLYFENISIFIIKNVDNMVAKYFGIRYLEITNGKVTSLLYGFYDDPNIGAGFMIVTILISLYIVLSKDIIINKTEKILLLCFSLVEYIYLVLCNSRGAEYPIYISLLICLCVFVYRIIYFEDRRLEVKNLLLAFSVVILVFFSWKTVQKVGFWIVQKESISSYVWVHKGSSVDYISLENFEKNYNSSLLTSREFITKEVNKENFKSEKDDSGEALGNGRLDIWKEGLNLYIKNPIFGIGAGYSAKYGPEFKTHQFMNLHNSYLKFLVSFGIITFVIQFAWIGKIMLSFFKKNVLYLNSLENNLLFYGMLAMFGMYFFLELAFNNIFFNQFVIMFLLGFLSYEYIEIEDN